MIPFNKASITRLEENYALQAMERKLSGDGTFTLKAYELLHKKIGIKNVLLTTSCTHALELAALLSDIKPGDEVIVPSYTFVSTVNAFLLRGAKPVFCDINPETLNMDEDLIENLITSDTRAIVPVHYAGVCCNLDKINRIALKYSLLVIEDAAQAVGSFYNDMPAGTLSDYGCYSFHETKNYVMGEGGAIIVRDENKLKQAEIIREKGTDRSRFLRGEIDKYTWQSEGSSYLPSEVLAAVLCGQIERYEEIMKKRMDVWLHYNSCLEDLEVKGKIKRPCIPEYSTHNAHMYYIITENNIERNALLNALQEKGVQAAFHYIPLHTSPMGLKLGYKAGDLPYTESYAGRIIRLPIWADLEAEKVELVIRYVKEYYE